MAHLLSDAADAFFGFVHHPRATTPTVRDGRTTPSPGKNNSRYDVSTGGEQPGSRENEHSVRQLADIRKFDEEVAHLQEANSALEQQIAKMRAELQAAQDASSKANELHHQTQEELRNIRRRFEKMKKTMFEWNQKGHGHDDGDEIAQLRAVNAALKEQNKQLLEELTKKHEELQAAHNALSKPTDETQRPINSENLDSHSPVKTNINKEFTILLVGETGVGKTMLLSLLANIVLGHNPEQFVNFNEETIGGGANQNETKDAKVYKFARPNGAKITILDTPGLADTHDLARDESHKARIASVIKENLTTINAVIVLVNGTVPRLGIATDYALSTLSSILPRSLADNIGVLFTHVSSPLSWNFDENSLPDFLQGHDDNQWLLDNPLAMWNKYLQIKAQPNVSKKVLSGLLSAVKEGHQTAVGVSKSMFDWLDDLKPQPTSDITSIYEQYLQMNREIEHAMRCMMQIGVKKKRVMRVKELAELAKKEKNKYESMIVALDELILDFDSELEGTLVSLGKLMESYARASLSGSFIGQVKKSIKLLEANLEGTMRKGKADFKSIEVIEKSLDHMKRKLKVVEVASEKVKGNV